MVELRSKDESINGKRLADVKTRYLTIPVPAVDGWGQKRFEYSGMKTDDGVDIWAEVSGD